MDQEPKKLNIDYEAHTVTTEDGRVLDLDRFYEWSPEDYDRYYVELAEMPTVLYSPGGPPPEGEPDAEDDERFRRERAEDLAGQEEARRRVREQNEREAGQS